MPNKGGNKCGIRLKTFFKRVLWFFLLFWALSSLSISAMAQEDIVNNLTVSQNLLGTLNLQLTDLETQLDNKNQSLLNLETTNQKLNEQLQNQTTTLSNLSEMNNKLMGQWEQSVQQLSESQTQLISLSEELRKAESSNIWWVIGGLAVGMVVGGVATWALITYL